MARPVMVVLTDEEGADDVGNLILVEGGRRQPLNGGELTSNSGNVRTRCFREIDQWSALNDGCVWVAGGLGKLSGVSGGCFKITVMSWFTSDFPLNHC